MAPFLCSSLPIWWHSKSNKVLGLWRCQPWVKCQLLTASIYKTGIANEVPRIVCQICSCGEGKRLQSVLWVAFVKDIAVAQCFYVVIVTMFQKGLQDNIHRTLVYMYKQQGATQWALKHQIDFNIGSISWHTYRPDVDILWNREVHRLQTHKMANNTEI